MTANTDITLYHKTYNRELREDEWSFTHFFGATWIETHKADATSSGLKAERRVILRIPTEEAVLAAPDDIVVKGIVTDTIIGAEQLLAKYTVCVIIGVTDNRKTYSTALRHWKIEGR